MKGWFNKSMIPVKHSQHFYPNPQPCPNHGEFCEIMICEDCWLNGAVLVINHMKKLELRISKKGNVVDALTGQVVERKKA